MKHVRLCFGSSPIPVCPWGPGRDFLWPIDGLSLSGVMLLALKKVRADAEPKARKGVVRFEAPFCPHVGLPLQGPPFGGFFLVGGPRLRADTLDTRIALWPGRCRAGSDRQPSEHHRPCDHLPSSAIVQCSITCAVQHRTCCSVLQPSLGVSSLDLGRPSGRPLFVPRSTRPTAIERLRAGL